MDDDHEVIVKAIISYAELLNQINTDKVAAWTVDFITQCKDWCIYMETELSVLDKELCQVIRNQAQEKSQYTIPALSQLLEAAHHFFYQLLQSVYIRNDVYLFIMRNYQFLTIPRIDMVTKDLSDLSQKAATKNILIDILHEFEDA